MAQRVRYEIDPYNRLIAINKGLELPKQRQVIDGNFVMGEDSSLSYRVKSPSDTSQNIPYQVKLQGAWSLTKDHDLKFTFDKSAGGKSGDSLIISGDIIDTRGDSLLFSVMTKREDGVFNTYVMEIAGVWQVDDRNRLSFMIKRSRGKYDSLLFCAGWDVDKNNEIVYRYEKRHLKRSVKTSHCLTLRGEWKICAKGILTYVVESKTGTALGFKASYGICGDDYIKYELGVKLSSNAKPVKKTVTLSGAWRIKKGSGLFFDVECSDGRVYSISLAAEAKLTAKDSIALKLKSEVDKKDIGIGLEINHAMLEGDGSAFIRFLKSCEESSIMIGAGLNW